MESGTGADAPARSSIPLRRKGWIRGGAAVLVILALSLFIPYFLHSLSHESTDDAFIEGNIIPVSPRVAGHVITVKARDNRWVKAGDLLVELDSRDFQARLDAAKADLESATAADRARKIEVELTRITSTSELDEARNNVESARAAVQEMSARLAISRAELDQAKAEADSASAGHKRDATDLDRYEEMAKTQTVSAQDLDHAKTAEQIAAADLTAAQKKVDVQDATVREAEAALKAAKANLRAADARLLTAQSAPQRIQQSRFQADVSGSNVDKANADMTQARLNLSYTKIVAPCDGFVTKKSVEPGQFVQVGQSLLAVVPREVWVIANFKETQLTRMKPGQPVEIKVDAYPDSEFHGHVDSIQRGTGARFSLLPPENATGNYVKVVQRVPVKIVFDHQKEEMPVFLTPGMSVVPDVDVGAEGWPEGIPKDSPTSNTSRAANKRADPSP